MSECPKDSAPQRAVPVSAGGCDRDLLDDKGLPVGYPFDPARELTPGQVKRLLDRGDEVLLIDCRTPQEHRVARIQEAVHVPIPALAGYVQEVQSRGGGKVVIHCHHGRRSMQMTRALRQQGLKDVWSMAGGIDLWSIGVDPGVPRY